MMNKEPLNIMPLEMELEDSVFEDLRDLIYTYSGIYLAESKKRILEKRLSSRLEELELPDYQQYYKFIKNAGSESDELHLLMDAVTVNETEFFRDQFQGKAIGEVVLPVIVKNALEEKKRQVRILSVGCSSGEEPYTLAMQIKNLYPDNNLPLPVEIIGTDLSNQMLQMAVRGTYREHAVRKVPDKMKQKYFRPTGKNLQLTDSIRKMVKFGQVNLNQQDAMLKIGTFDLILCRNVLIYFSAEARKKAMDTLYQITRPSGFLFTGYSESLHGIKHEFKLVHFVKAIGYKK